MSNRSEQDVAPGPPPGTDHVRPDTLASLLRENGERRGAEEALLCPERPSLDHAGLRRATLPVAAWLDRRGIDAGQVVAVSLANGPELAVALLGTACVAAAAPIGVDETEAEVTNLLDDLKPAAVLVARDSRSTLGRVAEARGLPILEVAPGERAGELVLPEGDGGRRLDDHEASPPQPRPEQIALVLHTSGTTARPKQVPITHASVCHAASWVVSSVGLGPEDRCLNLMPLLHSHGLLGALVSSLRGGGSIVCTTSFDPRDILRIARETQATWTTGAPTILRALLESPGDWPSLRFLRSASAPMPPDLAKALEVRFSVPQIQVYGLTEAYQVAANPLPPGERRPGTVGRPTGTDVAILDEDGIHREPGPQGEIVVRGPSVFSGYATTEGVDREVFHGTWFRTGDAGRLDDDGYLHVTGRLKEIINRGGENISPLEIEYALRRHDAVADAVCFPVPDARLGEEVGAVVVPAANAALDPRTLRRFAATHLSPTKVPRYFWLREALPRTRKGKLDRLSLARRLGLGAPEASAPDLPSVATSRPETRPTRGPATVAALRHLWVQVLQRDTPPGDDERFFDVGGTSLALVELMLAIEQRFGTKLPLGAILDAPTIRTLASQLDGTAPGAGERGEVVEIDRGDFRVGVVPIQPGGTRPPLLLVAPAGGSVLAFYALADRLGRDQPCYGLQVSFPRRAWRLELEIGALAEAFIEGLTRMELTGPWRVGGWSFGGFVAWELAARLRARGDEVSRVIVVDSDASHVGRPLTVARAVRGIGRLAEMIRHGKPLVRDALYVRLAVSRQNEREGRPSGPLRRAARRLLWRAGIGDAGIADVLDRDPRLLELRTKTLGGVGNIRHYLRAIRRYRPMPQPIDLDLVRAGLSPRTARRHGLERHTMGWEDYVLGTLRVHGVPGNHFTVLIPPQLDELAKALTHLLARRP